MRKFLIAAGLAAALITPSTAMAKDSAPAYTTFAGSCGSGALGTITPGKGIVTLGVPDASAYSIIRLPQTGLKVKDIKTLSFKSNSSMSGMVYMQIITNDAAGTEHRIKYTPFEQTPFVTEPGINSWYTHNPMTSGIRYGENINDSLPTTTWAEAVNVRGNDTVNRVSITAGCALGSGTVQLDRIQVNNTVTGF